MTEEADKTSSLWHDSYLALIPLLGAAIALTYDVGYFWAIDISFFTLFSLSEHIVFAIQPFPIALVLLLPISAILVIMSRGGPSVPPSNDPTKVVTRRQWIAAWGGLILIALTLLSFLGYILLKFPAGLLLAVEFGLAAWGYYYINPLYRRPFITSITVAIMLTFSFIFGNLFGASVLSNEDTNRMFTRTNETVYFKNGVSINGRIIRSGERGVLVYDPGADRIHFELWDAIRSIEATPPKPPR